MYTLLYLSLCIISSHLQSNLFHPLSLFNHSILIKNHQLSWWLSFNLATFNYFYIIQHYIFLVVDFKINKIIILSYCVCVCVCVCVHVCVCVCVSGNYSADCGCHKHFSVTYTIPLPLPLSHNDDSGTFLLLRFRGN